MKGHELNFVQLLTMIIAHELLSCIAIELITLKSWLLEHINAFINKNQGASGQDPFKCIHEILKDVTVDSLS